MVFPPAPPKTPISPFCWHFIKKYRFTNQIHTTGGSPSACHLPNQISSWPEVSDAPTAGAFRVRTSIRRREGNMGGPVFGSFILSPNSRPKAKKGTNRCTCYCPLLATWMLLFINMEVFCIWYFHHWEEISKDVSLFQLLSFSSLTCFRSLMVISTGTNFPSWQGHSSCGYQGSWGGVHWPERKI